MRIVSGWPQSWGGNTVRPSPRHKGGLAVAGGSSLNDGVNKVAQTVHLKLKVNGNDVVGESSINSLDRSGTIECIDFSYGVTTPREPATGALTGRRQHRPVKIRKRIDKTTPVLLKALCRNEKVEKAVFNFYRPSPDGSGDEEMFYSIELTEGYVDSIEQVSNDAMMSGVEAPPVTELVSFVFRNITWTYTNGGVTHTDSWADKV